MANLAITRRCLRGCAYCFAADEHARGASVDMSSEVFERALDFLERSGVTEARLLGGEPLLRPAFGALARRAFERGFGVTVMTGGQVPSEAIAELGDLAEGVPGAQAGTRAEAPTGTRAEALAGAPVEAPARLTVFLNVAVPGRDDPALMESQELLLAALGPRVELGLTVDAETADLLRSGATADFLLGLIERHGARRSIRLGVAHPVWGGMNDDAAPVDLRALGPAIEALVEDMEEGGVRVGFDCGLVPCMLSPAFAARHPRLMAQTGVRCGPIVDVLPEGETIACFALSHGPRIPLADASVTRADLAAHFNRWFEVQPHVGIFDDCGSCAHRAGGRCEGGCRARQLGRVSPPHAGAGTWEGA